VVQFHPESPSVQRPRRHIIIGGFCYQLDGIEDTKPMTVGLCCVESL
jgi:hypothetical protein